MLSPSYLSQVPNAVTSLYLDLELSILTDMARRIKKTGKFTATTDWQFLKMQELERSYSFVMDEISRTLQKSQTELLQTYNAAAMKSLSFDERIYARASKAGIIAAPTPLAQSTGFSQTILLGVLRTQGTLTNLCGSMGRVAGAELSTLLDRSYLQVASGAFNYQTAISNSVKELARNGIHSIDYQSGRKISIEAGVRRAVLTGVNQTAAAASMARAEEVESDLVIVSQHAGSRPEHAVFQGKVFSRSGSNTKYGNFYAETGYGSADGLCGVNCRHSFSPYFEGFSLGYDDKIDSEENAEQYELEQEQRYNERMIRKWKREADIYEAGGLDDSYARAKVQEWQAAQRSLINQNSELRRDYFREKIG